ncbi:hypothetical protein QBC32DRAFT_258253 [Pseudoneurospora amorphoporcata]|uniref:Uncharacterized protein n=1 Tax=Pseudoneurospora amorphoporcata TaxID=241081 RepID=A0AAN6SGC4_9PEZI|nr:hypothetical protein QBC32DRAFT_258253 [Pseudoneurospora amorphoporcata]
MTSTPPYPPVIPLPIDASNANSNDNNDNDDAQSDISIPYSSLTESTISTGAGSDFLTPTASSDAQSTAAGDSEGVNLQTITSVLNEMDPSSYQGHDERIDDSLAQWRSLYREEIEQQIVDNRNRDRSRTMMTTSNALSAGNLQLHTSQTSETLTREGGGGGAGLDGNGQTRRRKGKGREEGPKSSPSDSSSSSHTRSSTPTPQAYESAPSSPSGAGAQKPRYIRHAAPFPGQTYILLEASTGRALTLIDGNLRLVHVPDPDLISITDQSHIDLTDSSVAVPTCAKGQCNWHWHCVETAGWLGFRNAASGTFLGHDMWQNIVAKAYRHNGWEWMAVRPTPGGPEGKGWHLLVTHWEKLYRIKFLEGGAFVAMDSTEGTVWEFVGLI